MNTWLPSLLLVAALPLLACNEGRERPSPSPARERAPANGRARLASPCEQTMEQLAALDASAREAQAAPTPEQLTRALARWSGTVAGEGLRPWVERVDLQLGRSTPAGAIDLRALDTRLASLSADRPDELQRGLAFAVATIRALALLEMRRLLTAVSEGRGDARSQWREARCLWEGALRPLAARADALPEAGAEDWEQGILELFDATGKALDDALRTAVAKQRIEKGSYAVLHRVILANAERPSPAALAEARGLLLGLEDRVADRNGPGLLRMQAMLSGAAGAVDASAIEHELAIAFAKRARKYCDHALVTGEFGTPKAIAEAWEGIVYSALILPGMEDALGAEGFDGDAYSESWQRYLEAVEASESEAAAARSLELIEWNCAYQAQLGLSGCSASGNELE